MGDFGSDPGIDPDGLITKRRARDGENSRNNRRKRIAIGLWPLVFLKSNLPNLAKEMEAS